jgi:TRAP transporter 4TM/12TM fusion protein
MDKKNVERTAGDAAPATQARASQATESSRLNLGTWSDLASPVPLIALAWSLAQIAFVLDPGIDTLVQRSLHVGFALMLSMAMFGLAAPRRSAKRIGWLLAGLVAFLPTLYIVMNSTFLVSERMQGIDPVSPTQYAMGLLLVVALLEVGRRVLGWGMVVFALAFVLYFFLGPYLPGDLAHRYTGLERFIDAQYLSLHGIFGVPVGVSVSTVFYFILFAAIYDAYGGGRMIIDIAFAITGRSTGGPAKAAVVSSGLLGSVSGSAVANVMSTGIFTIPLMKKVGYSARFAGAVEAAASTGGQLVPPVMGAAAFIMADYLRLPYQQIVLAAILPALAYYLALLLMVDLKARREGLRPSRALDGVRIAEVLAARGHLLLPLAWLVYRVVAGHPVNNAALEAGALTIVVGSLRANTRQGPITLVEALIVSAERTISVALPCAVAGIVVAVIAFTGLGTKFTSLMIFAAGGSIGVLLVLTMLASLVLGTGMPTTSAYIMAAVLLSPALIELGVVPLGAHFFIFYFAILSMVTPPVALAAYAAASISGAPPSDTGWSAFVLCLPGFMIPFVAIAHPGLFLLGDAMDSVWGLMNVLLGFFALGVAIVGWLFHPLGWLWRIAFGLVGLVALLPDVESTVVCVALLSAGTLMLWLPSRRVAK